MEVQKTVSFTEALLRYQQAIADLSAAKSPELSQILAVLTSRDAVEAACGNLLELTGDRLAELVELDDRLRQLAGAIATHPEFAQCHQTLQPPETAWWWFLEAPTPPPPRFSQYDWLWNLLTVASLVGAGTFATDTIKAFSHNSLDLLQTFSTISQGAGLVLVTGGTLTSKGQQVVRDTLSKIGVRPEYEAELTCGLAVLLLAATYGINASIPNLGKYYYLQGMKAYNNGYIDRAKLNFEKAQSLAPNNAEIAISLGDVYETLALHKQANELYQPGIIAGRPRAFNGAGRAQLRMATSVEDLIEAESLLNLGLAQPKASSNIKYFLYTHLGFALIRQAELGNFAEEKAQILYARAEEALNVSIALESKVKQTIPGWGMNYCYLGILYDKQEKMAIAKTAWQNCQDKAKPTSKSEYKDIVIYGKPEIAQNIDVTKIVQFSPSKFLKLEELTEQKTKN